MTLRSLIDRIGAKKFAQRLSLSERTVQRWLKTGQVSAKYADKVAKMLARSEGSIKAAQTKKERDEFQRSLELPELPVSSLEHPAGSPLLSRSEVIPRQPPTVSRDVAESEGEGIDQSIVDTDRWYGYTEWRTPGGFEGADVREIDWDEVKRDAIATFRKSKYEVCSVYFMFVRYIPHNPTYTGELVDKQGTWAPFWTSTAYQSDDEAIEAAIEDEIAGVRKWSHTRIIFLKAYGVKLLRAKKTPLPPITRIDW